MALNRKTAVRALHDPFCRRKAQGVATVGGTTDFTRFLAPDSIMTMLWSNQRMGNLMQDGIPDMVGFSMTDIMP